MTREVLAECASIGGAASRTLLDAAIAAGWVRTVASPPAREVERIITLEPRLSPADAGLLLVCVRDGLELFTDDEILARASLKAGIDVYGLVDALRALKTRGVLSAADLRTIVLDIHFKDGRVFTPSELSALDLDGLL